MTRSRNAPTARATSDVTRFAGVAIAAVVAVAVTVVAAIALSGASARSGSPGPLARSHTAANLNCQSCHSTERASDSCAGCHGAHESSRSGHRARAARGDLACGDCHQIHRANAGVVITASGDVLRYGPGSERDVSSLVAGVRFRPPTDVTVPIVEVAACNRCHDASSARDPLARCLSPSVARLGDRQPTLCFDEHTRAGGPRDGAWEAARQVALAAPAAPGRPSGSRSGPWSWLGLGLLSATLCWSGVRVTRRRRSASQSARLAAVAAIEPVRVLRLPTINRATCIGCYACVDACPYDVLEIRNYVAQVARPADCCGLTLCEQRCPNQSLTMGDGVAVTGEVPVDASLQSEQQAGLYLAGDITGMPLIRNAINQGAHAVKEIAAGLRGSAGKADLDLIIVGAGPAGLSAALEAKSRGLRYLALEQGSVAGSVRSFPRGKLVFDQPLDIPLIGELWLEESTKEELIGQWLRIVRAQQLAIREGHRVSSIERDADAFAVTAHDEHERVHHLTARRILLAIGRRGSPRALPIEIPDAVADRVYYSLADARSFAGQRVLVVGLGDVAMEAATALSRQPGTQVHVSYRGSGFQRGKARNIAELQRRIAAGAVQMHFDSDVIEIEPGRATLSIPTHRESVPCDAVLVLIGSIPPTSFLERVGLGVDTKESES